MRGEIECIHTGKMSALRLGVLTIDAAAFAALAAGQRLETDIPHVLLRFDVSRRRRNGQSRESPWCAKLTPASAHALARLLAQAADELESISGSARPPPMQK